jgi:uracil-DNA glycosylase family 4
MLLDKTPPRRARRDDIYIANVLKCRPEQPRSLRIETCRPFLDEQLEIVARACSPDGNFALNLFSPKANL